MTRSDRRTLKSDAAEALRGASCSPVRLALIHSAVTAALALLIALLDYLLERQIAGTGGLAGIQSRSLLQTAQTLLQTANLLLVPFWEMGLLWAMLSISRGQEANPKSLLQGFRHFGPVFRGKLMQGFLLMGFGILGAYIGMYVFQLTPLANAFAALAEEYIRSGITDPMALMEDPRLVSASLPVIPFMVGGMLIFMLPAYYRLRLMDLILVDHPEKGALFALLQTRMLMRGRRWALLKLDLSFWWFYLLQGVIGVVCYGEMLLPMLGVELSISQDAAYFLFYALALAGQVALFAWKRPYVMTTYVQFYEAVLPKEEIQEETPLG